MDFLFSSVSGGAFPRTLHTPRVQLRPWVPADRVPFALMNADPEVMEYFPAPLTREESDALADRISDLIVRQGWGLWAVEQKKPDVSHGIFIGFVGLNAAEGLPFSPCIEIGWRLARPFWGQGYATEAARACLEFAFSSLKAKEIVSFTARGNLRSQAVMQRLGMAFVGKFDHPRVPEGHPLSPHVLYRKRAGEE